MLVAASFLGIKGSVAWAPLSPRSPLGLLWRCSGVCLRAPIHQRSFALHVASLNFTGLHDFLDSFAAFSCGLCSRLWWLCGSICTSGWFISWYLHLGQLSFDLFTGFCEWTRGSSTSSGRSRSYIRGSPLSSRRSCSAPPTCSWRCQWQHSLGFAYWWSRFWWWSGGWRFAVWRQLLGGFSGREILQRGCLSLQVQERFPGCERWLNMGLQLRGALCLGRSVRLSVTRLEPLFFEDFERIPWIFWPRSNFSAEQAVAGFQGSLWRPIDQGRSSVGWQPFCGASEWARGAFGLLQSGCALAYITLKMDEMDGALA